MKTYDYVENIEFIGRKIEIGQIHDLFLENEAFICLVYGRRRIGKTTLIETAFKDRNILKFEGIQSLLLTSKRISKASIKKYFEYQIKNIQKQLIRYIENDSERKRYEAKDIESWSDFFELIYEYTKTGTWTLYFEEIQWLSSYTDNFFAEFKECWDNLFRRNPNLGVVISGSSPSFIVSQILSSKALYGRINLEINLGEFNLQEVSDFLGKSRSRFQIMEAIMLIGGIPEYLKRIKAGESTYLELCKNSLLFPQR